MVLMGRANAHLAVNAASVSDTDHVVDIGCGPGNAARAGAPVGPWVVERAVDKVRPVEEFQFHCLRHHLATLLIANRCDVKVVQARMRHGSARTTLDVYAHDWERQNDREDDPARTAVAGAITARAASSSGNPAGAVRAKRS
jgi:hypothetical protein